MSGEIYGKLPITAMSTSARSAFLWLCSTCDQRLRDAGFGNFEIGTDRVRSDVIAELMAYVEQIDDCIKRGRNVVLWGGAGVGKDHLLCALSKQATIKEYGVEVCSPSVVAGLTYSDLEDSAFMQRMANADVLWMSDPIQPGRDAHGDKPRDQFLQRIIYARYETSRPIFVSINCDSEKQLNELMPKNLLSRLFQGDSLVLRCAWPQKRIGG